MPSGRRGNDGKAGSITIPDILFVDTKSKTMYKPFLFRMAQLIRKRKFLDAATIFGDVAKW